MADQYGLFFNSINGDRIYDADSFSEWLNKFFTTGVFNGELEVTADSGMAVTVASGYANINGKVRFFEQSQTFTLDPASGVYPRVDSIVVRLDTTNRMITTEYVKGDYSGNNPQPTEPTRTGGLYEIVLAQIYVSAGATQILTNDITDTRADDSVCGWVTSTVEGVPMDQIVSQMQAQFLTWFDEMKDQLSEDAAGHLQQEIDAIEIQLNTLSGAVAVHTLDFADNEGEGTSASRAYEVGEYLMKYNGFRKVTSPISAGSPINESNSEATNVGAELQALNTGLTSEGTGYVKFPDGTLICYGETGNILPDSLTGKASGTLYFHEYKVSITFPVPFVSGLRLIVSKTGGREASVSWVSHTNIGINEIDTLGGVQTLTNSNTANFTYIAIGRWK